MTHLSVLWMFWRLGAGASLLSRLSFKYDLIIISLHLTAFLNYIIIGRREHLNPYVENFETPIVDSEIASHRGEWA